MNQLVLDYQKKKDFELSFEEFLESKPFNKRMTLSSHRNRTQKAVWSGENVPSFNSKMYEDMNFPLYPKTEFKNNISLSSQLKTKVCQVAINDIILDVIYYSKGVSIGLVVKHNNSSELAYLHNFDFVYNESFKVIIKNKFVFDKPVCHLSKYITPIIENNIEELINKIDLCFSLKHQTIKSNAKN